MIKITLAEIRDNKFLNQKIKEVEDIINFFKNKEAKLFYHSLVTALDEYGTKIDGEMYQAYVIIIKKMAIVAIPLLENNEIEKIFRESLAVALVMDIDLIERLKTKLIGMPLEDRNPFKKSLSSALEANKEVISGGKLHVTIDKNGPANISNWIKSYRGFTEGRYFNQIKNTEFYTKNKIFNTLSVQNRQNVKKIIELYRFLHRSSEDIEGFDESFIVNDKGVTKVFNNGILEVVRKKIGGSIDSPANKKMSAISPLESLKEKYNEYRRNRWNILRLEDEILVATKGEIDLIKKELSLAARQGQKDRLIASVKILSRQNSLVDALSSSPAWISALGENIVSKYSSQNEPDDIAEIVSNVKENINSPAVVSEFLQYLLKDKLKMSENDSALVATDIGQLLGDEYQTMSFGNQSTGSFEWTKSKIENHSLVFDIS